MGLGHLRGIELTEYLDGGLSPARTALAERHLAACEPCRRALAELRATVHALKAVPAIAPPADLRSRVVAKLGAGVGVELTCGQAAPLIHAHLDGELSATAVTAVQRHMRECVRCRAEFVVVSKLVGMLRSLRSLTPPAVVRETVWATRRGLPAVRDAGGTPALPGRWRRQLRPALALAAVGAALLAFAFLLPAHRPTQIAAKPPSVSPPAPTETAMANPPITVASQPPSVEGSQPGGPAALAETSITEEGGRTAARGEATGAYGGTFEARPAARRGSAVSYPRDSLVRTALDTPSRGGESRERELAPAVPPAVLTLKAIANAAGGEPGGHRSMTAAGERFATLNWEASLATPPQAKPEAALPAGRRDDSSSGEVAPGVLPDDAGVSGAREDHRTGGLSVNYPWV